MILKLKILFLNWAAKVQNIFGIYKLKMRLHKTAQIEQNLFNIRILILD